jgi:hypothetical protein
VAIFIGCGATTATRIGSPTNAARSRRRSDRIRTSSVHFCPTPKERSDTRGLLMRCMSPELAIHERLAYLPTSPVCEVNWIRNAPYEPFSP